MSYRFASGKRQDLCQDYLQRAQIRRKYVIDTLMQHGAHADVIKEACTIVDFATLALLIFERVDLSPQNIADGTLPLDETHNSLAAILRILQKDHSLSEYAVGAVVISEYYTEGDARAALLYADHMLKLIAERLVPRLEEAQAALEAEQTAPALEAPTGLLSAPELPNTDPDDDFPDDAEEGPTEDR